MSRSGFVSLLGRPNAGKSTLLNALVGEKLAIVSDKPQTTRTTIQGVANIGGAQVVFVDTPGIHKSTTLFNRRMMETVRSVLEERDVLLYVVDGTVPFSRTCPRPRCCWSIKSIGCPTNASCSR
jgi:GTP-binding protein Era